MVNTSWFSLIWSITVVLLTLRSGHWVSCTPSACVVPSGSPTLDSRGRWIRWADRHIRILDVPDHASPSVHTDVSSRCSQPQSDVCREGDRLACYPCPLSLHCHSLCNLYGCLPSTGYDVLWYTGWCTVVYWVMYWVIYWVVHWMVHCSILGHIWVIYCNILWVVYCDLL